VTDARQILRLNPRLHRETITTAHKGAEHHRSAVESWRTMPVVFDSDWTVARLDDDSQPIAINKAFTGATRSRARRSGQTTTGFDSDGLVRAAARRIP